MFDLNWLQMYNGMIYVLKLNNWLYIMGKPKKNNGRNDRTLSRVSRDFSSTSFKDSSVYDDVDLGNVEPQQSSTCNS